ncbi:MAG: oligosaccharide flippase family protein [Nitrospirales bacterium]
MNRPHFSSRQSDTFYATLSNGLDVAIFVLMVAIGRFLGEEEFGKLSFVQSLAMVFISLGNFGLAPIITRDVSHDRSKAPLYRRSVMPWTASLSIVALLLFASYLYLNNQDNLQLVWIGVAIGFATVFRYLTMNYRTLFEALGRFDLEFRNVLLENIFLIPLCLFLLIVGYGLLEVSFGIAFSRLLGLIIQNNSLSKFLGEKRWYLAPNWSTAFTLQKTAIPLGIGIAVGMLSLNTDTILLTYLTDFSQVGLYSASFKIFVGLLVIPSIATNVLLPRIARAGNSGNAIKEFWIGSVSLLIVATGLVGTLGIFSTEIIIFLFGASYSAAGDIFFWHLVTCIPAFQVVIVRTYLIGIGQSQTFLVLTIFGLILRAVSIWVIVPQFGLVPGVQAVCAAEMITYFAALIYILTTHDRPKVVALN